ncbi:MAG: tetratricopeptide repeat protein, partial [Candidatus Omnitrophota bacterium]
ALDIDEKRFGKDSPDIVTDLNNLATVYSYQNKYADSEALYRRAVDITEKTSGPDSPNLIMILSNMSDLCEKTSRKDEAKSLLARAKRLYESRLP